MRGRGRGRGGRGRGGAARTGAIDGDAAPVAPEAAAPPAADGEQNCGTCSLDVGESSIGCDHCETWVHGTEMCSGLPQDVLDTILKYSGQGIKFVCMKCRLDKPSGKQSSGTDREMKETLQQLFQQFSGMCKTLADLSSQVKALTQGGGRSGAVSQSAEHVTAGPPGAVSSGSSPNPDRKLIREELTEMRERDKRRHSIIIKGLAATGPGELSTKFSELTETQFGTTVSLTDICQIPGHPSMYRARITSDEQRKFVLDNVKKLKGSVYNSIYISRDLTRAQRTELYEKRIARRNQLSTTATGSNSAPSPSAAGAVATAQPAKSDPPGPGN